MRVIPTAIPDVKLIEPKKFSDERGFFSQTWSARDLAAAGIDLQFVQDNHALSRAAGVLRGLHYQAAPHAQAKLIRVTRGRIVDVAVDIRRSSPTFGRHFMAELSAENWLQMLVPVGFAHGYLTLEPDTEVLYKVTSPYAPTHDRGIAWNDPTLGIKWPVAEGIAILSEKDRRLPKLRDAIDLFP
jgi:dTDP-4-dehydrorhamnose 3,5-epimerase